MFVGNGFDIYVLQYVDGGVLRQDGDHRLGGGGAFTQIDLGGGAGGLYRGVLRRALGGFLAARQHVAADNQSDQNGQNDEQAAQQLQDRNQHSHKENLQHFSCKSA